MVLGIGRICSAAIVGRRCTAQGWVYGTGRGRSSTGRWQRTFINVIAIVVVRGRQESRAICATRDLVLVRGAFRKAPPDSIVPSVHVLGKALLILKEVTANFVRITKEVRCGPAIFLGHRSTCIGVPVRIPVTVTRCGGRIKPKLGGISIRLVQVPFV